MDPIFRLLFQGLHDSGIFQSPISEYMDELKTKRSEPKSQPIASYEVNGVKYTIYDKENEDHV